MWHTPIRCSHDVLLEDKCEACLDKLDSIAEVMQDALSRAKIHPGDSPIRTDVLYPVDNDIISRIDRLEAKIDQVITTLESLKVNE